VSFTILVLDDEPWQLSWVTDVATARGGKCVFTDTYENAKSAFDKESPEIVIIDIRIGDVDEPLVGATLTGSAYDPSWIGLRLLRFIRVERNSKATRLLVYTGLDREGIQRIAEDAFSARFFTKFEPVEFQQALISEIKRLDKKATT